MTFDPNSARPENTFDPNSAALDTGPPVKAVLRAVAGVNPDEMAEAQRLAKRYPAPVDTLYRNLADARAQEAVDLADERLKTSPKLAKAMTDARLAMMAKDDIEPLAKIESNFATVAAASVGQAVLGISEGIWRTPDAAQRAVGYLAGTVEKTGLPRYLNPIRGVQDVLRFISEGRVPAVGSMGGTTQIADKVNDAQKLLADNPATFGTAFKDVQTLAQNADKALATAVKTGNLQQLGQVIADPNYWSAFMSQAIPSLYLAMKSGGSVAFMGWLEGMEQAGNAAEFEKKTGQKISDAEFTQAVAQTAIVNALLEKTGLSKVLDAKGQGLKGIAKAMLGEGGTEGLQQINSNLAALFSYNEDQSITEGVLASVMGGVGSGAGVSSAQAAAGKVADMAAKQAQKADAAKQFSDHLSEQLKTAGGALLRERSPEQFRALMAEMTDGSVYVDGEVLNQLPPEVIAALPQSAQDQIATAAATGDVVEISTADVLTIAPGTPLEQVLVEHAKTDPFAMSQAEAAQAGEQAQKLLKDEADRVLAAAEDQDAMRASAEVVRTTLLEQINATGRYRPAVAEGMSQWAGAFYTTMAARTGMTPEQFYQAHPLRILGAPSATASGPVMDSQLEQPGTPAFDAWFGDSKVRDAEGKPLVVYHGTAAQFDVFDYSKIGQQGRSEGAGFYFTNSKDVASGYGPPLEVFLSIRNPLAYDAPGFSKAVVQKIVKRVAELEAQAEGGDIADGFLANFGDVRSEGLQRVVREAADMIAADETALDQLSGIVGSGVNPEFVNRATRDVTGHDGVVANGFSNEGGADNRIFVAFFPEQIKSATGNNGNYDPKNPSILEQAAYHGTPHKVDRFSLHKIGTGEGAQAYGWGLYFAGKREVAEHYRKTLSDTTAETGAVIVNGQKVDTFSPEGHAARLLFYNDQREMRTLAKQMLKDANKAEPYAVETAQKAGLSAKDYYGRLNTFISTHTRKNINVIKGNLYTVELPEDGELLDYDKSLGAQPPAVKERLKASGILKDWKESRSDYSLPQEVRPDRGGAFYALLSNKFGSDQAASQYLNSIGIKGMRYKAGQITGVRGGGHNYVIWDEGAISEPQSLYQNAPAPRGTFNPATLELVLNPNANLSTFFHETGHFFLEVLADIASQPNAPAQITEDMGAFLKWAGIPDLQTWNALDLDGKRQYHERWAESIEQYVMEGKAPSVELQPLMRRFATWLKSVYGSIKQFLAARGQATSGPVLGQADDSEAQADAVYSEIANDQEMIDALEVYMVSGDPPEGALNDKLLDYINRLPPVPADSYLTFYRNQPRGARPWARGWSSWTINEDQTRYFGGRDFEVLKRKGVHGLDLNRLGEYRTRATGEYSQYGSQGEWLVLNESVFNQDPTAQPGPQMALNDDIRRVMDRLLATDEQIAQANEVAGLVPDVDADATAAERLNKRSMADLKWAVKARDQVIAKLKKQAAAIEKDLRERVAVEVDQTPEMRAKRALDALTVSPEYAGTLAEHKAARKAAEAAVRDEVKAALLATNPEAKGLVKGQLLAKNKRDIDNKVEAAMIKWDAANPAPKRPVNATDADVATIADSFGFESVDAMMQAIDAFGPRTAAIDGLTEQRMLEEHGDLIDERAIKEAANEAVHNEARARSLASELRTQGEMLGARTDTGETNAKGSKITVNALVAAAKQFAANVVGKTPLRDLKGRAWQHTAAERRAAKRWTEATAAGKTAEAVKAKQDQMLNHAAAKAAIDAQSEARKILDFFKRVTKGNDETVVEKGRDPDIVNAARAALAAYGIETPASKGAQHYLDALAKNDPETYNVIKPMIDGATQNAQPLEALTFDELVGLHEEIQAMWYLAKRSRQMEVDGNLMDVEDAAAGVYTRLEAIGIPDTIPGETGALTKAEELARRWLQQAPALLRRVEQWAEAKDGKFGGPFLRYVFQPVKDAADRYRADRVEYRRKFQALVDNIAPLMRNQLIAAPELGYTFGRGHNGIGTAELLHALLHTGNESNKRKLLLGRGWATDNGDGTIDTAKWDAFIKRMADTGVLQPAHYDFVQGVWDLMEETKPLAQKTHRDVFGRYFAEITADSFADPWGQARTGGYVPAVADPALVQDADLRELLETENAGMAQAFPATNKGFTKSRVEYNRPLKLDLRTLAQHIDKVLLFSHMEPAVRGAAKLLRQPNVAQPLARVDPAAMGGMLKPWLNRSARQTVETPIPGDAGLNRVASTIRGRVGMALMFGNVSNTLQQITGFTTATLKVKPGLMLRAAAQFIRHPKKLRESVWALSPYMADRASNEVAVLSDTMEKILIDPSVYERAEMWTRQHGYFLQTAFDNVMSPIIWSASYNQAVAQGMDERMAVRYADGVVRQTQGSTLPEDVSRIETGPAYARLFTQFIGYFNMMVNTNATALQQIAAEQGLKKGAGKAFGVVMMGLLVPIWVAEAIANGMRGGPEDDDDDGYLDDWLAAVFGFGTIRGMLAGVPFLGAAAQSAVNRFNDQPADDKFSLSPTVSVLESAVGAPSSVYKAIMDDASAQKAVRDVSALITVATGLPAMTVARPVGYLAGVADEKIEPTSAADAARGLVTGTASPESKVR